LVEQDAQFVTGWAAESQEEQALMSSEDFIPDDGSRGLLEGDELEEMLEVLIGVAQSEGRDFLAYLLRMALMEARNHNATATHLPH
jgi:hypothetical protein